MNCDRGQHLKSLQCFFLLSDTEIGIVCISCDILHCQNCICQTGGIICNYLMLCIVRIEIVNQLDEIDSIAVPPYSQQVAMLSGTNLSDSCSKHVHFLI